MAQLGYASDSPISRPDAPHESQFSTVWSETQKDLEVLSQTIGALEKRLIPVLRGRGPEAVNKAQENATPSLVPVALAVHEIGKNIHSLNQTLLDIIARVEV